MAIPTNLPSNVHRTHSRFSPCRNDSSSNNSGEASLLVGQLLGDPAYLRQSIAALGERDGPLQLIQGWRLEPIRQRQAAVNHKGCSCDVARYPVRKHSESNWRQILGPPKTPERNVPGQRRVRVRPGHHLPGRQVVQLDPVAGAPEDPARSNEEWADAHAAFHLALIDGCDSLWLIHLHSQLYAQSERYRRLSVPLAGRRRNVDKEHRAIVRAVLARDAKTAVRLLTAHLEKTTQILLDADVDGHNLFEDAQERAFVAVADE